MALRVVIEESGVEVSANRLRLMGDRAADAAPVFEFISQEIMAHEAEVFASQGPGWPHLSASTIANKGHSTILEGPTKWRGQSNLRLKESLTSHNHDTKLIITPRGLVFGSNVPYAHFAAGTSRQPPRPYLRITPGQVVSWARSIETWIMGVKASTISRQRRETRPDRLRGFSNRVSRMMRG